MLAAIEAAFPETDREKVLALVDQYGTQPYERERERVQLAIIELSDGNMEKLRYNLASAKTDYRDLLAWQQLGPLSKTEGERMRTEAAALIGKWGKK